MAASEESQLYWASKQGDRNKVQDLLKEQVNPWSSHAIGASGDTPLHWACRYGWLNIAKAILEYNCQTSFLSSFVPSQFDSTNHIEMKEGTNLQTPIYYACRGGHMNVVRYLTEQRKCDLNLEDKNHYMPVDYALSCGQTEVVQYLIDKHKCKPRRELTLTHDLEWTWLKFACHFGYLEIVKSLNPQSFQLGLHYACESGNLDIVQYLVDLNHDYSTRDKLGMTPLHYACKHGHLKIVQYFDKLQHNLSLNDDKNQTPMHLACIGGHYNVVEFLANKTCDFETKDVDNQSPRDYALKLGHFKIIKMFMSFQTFDPISEDTESNHKLWLNFACQYSNEDIIKSYFAKHHTSHDKTSDLMHVACQYGSLSVVKCLHELKYDHNVTNKLGQTPLHLACQAGHFDIVQYLKELGCKMQATEKQGRTPLHYSCLNGHKEIVEYLCSFQYIRSDLQVKDRYNSSPLDCAWQNKHYKVVDYLLKQQKCLPTEQFKDVCSSGWTWLTYAASHGHFNVVKFLIDEMKCDPNSTDSKQKTALHYSCQEGHFEIVKYLDAKQCSFDMKDTEHRTALDLARLDGHDQIVQYLCESIDENTLPLVHLACQNGNIKSIESFSRDILEEKDNHCRTPMHIACASGKLAIVKHLVDKHCSIDVRDKEQQTPMHYAAKHGHVDIVEYFIKQHHNNVDSLKDVDQMTPLHHACKNGHLRVVKCFYNHDNNSNLNAKDKYERTPLHYACHYGHIEVVRYLSGKEKCDKNALDSEKKTPLHYACNNKEKDNKAIVELLVDLDCQPEITDMHKRTPLHYASKSGQIKTLRYLVKRCICNSMLKDNEGQTSLHLACMNGHFTIVKELTESMFCNPQTTTMKGWTPLHYASQSGQTEILCYLVKTCGCNSVVEDLKGYTPLHVACKNGHFTIVKKLIESMCCNPEVKTNSGITPVYIASKHGHIDILKYLITEKKCNPNVLDIKRVSPLHVACQNGHFNVAQYLINNKLIKINVEDADRRTPLHYACIYGHKDITECLLMKGGTNLNVRDIHLMTPLHLACQYGHIDIVKFLVIHFPTTDLDKYGRTPLHIALNVTIVKFFVNVLKCDPNKVDYDGNTTLHLAVKQGKLGMLTASFLLHEALCDPHATNKCGLTPVQCVSDQNIGLMKDFMEKTHDHVSLYRHLNTIVTDKCSLDSVMHDITPEWKADNLICDTALHVACKADSPFIVKYLLEHKRFDPTITNNVGKTPLEVLPNNNGQIVSELLRFGAIPLTPDAQKISKDIMNNEKPPQPFVNVFVVGDGSSGKSTLVASLQHETWLTSSKLYLFSKKVSDVPMFTTGIIPYDFESLNNGNIVLHDFAGHRELHSNQAAVLQNAECFSSPMPAIYLVVVNINKSKDEVSQSIDYWMSFIYSQSTPTEENKHRIIVVGSHTDKLNSAKKVTQKLEVIKEIAQENSGFAGVIDLDCQYPDSQQMTKLRELLAKDCNDLRIKDKLKFNAHCFLKYVMDSFNERCGIQLKEVMANMTKNPRKHITNFIPQDVSMLACICRNLHNRGHILFLQSREGVGSSSFNTNNVDEESFLNSWIIIKKSTLLEKITGTNLVPLKLQEGSHARLASSTGVVPLSKVKMETYKDDTDDKNVEMLVEVMSYFDICHEISDSEVGQRFIQRKTIPGERYFLFPNLFAKNIPQRVWKQEKNPKYNCGWILRCTQKNHIFPLHVFTVLVPKLSFSILKNNAQIVRSVSEDTEFPAIQQPCSIWKNGIYWSNDDGGEALLQFFDNGKAIMIQFRHTALNAKCLQLRSKVIRKVQNSVREVCPRITTKEYFIDPEDIKNHQTSEGVFGADTVCSSLADFESQYNVYSLSSIAASLMVRYDDNSENMTLYVRSECGTQIPIESLLCFEPYAVINKSGLNVLLNPSCSRYASEVDPDTQQEFEETLSPVLSINFSNVATSQNCDDTTYMDLHKRLETLSIFSDRNDIIQIGKLLHHYNPK